MVSIEDKRDTKGDQFGLVQVDHVPTGARDEVYSPVTLRCQFALQRQPQGLEGITLRRGRPTVAPARDYKQWDLRQGRSHAHGTRAVPESQQLMGEGASRSPVIGLIGGEPERIRIQPRVGRRGLPELHQSVAG